MEQSFTLNFVPPRWNSFTRSFGYAGLNHLVGNNTISRVVGNKRGVKIQASTAVRCPRASLAPHPHTFGNTKFGAKVRCHSSRFRTLEIIDAAKGKLSNQKRARRVGSGWRRSLGLTGGWQHLSDGQAHWTVQDMFFTKASLLLALEACWWLAGRRCVGEQLVQRWWNKGVSWGRWQSSWADCVAGVQFHILTGVESLLHKQIAG